MQNKTNLHKHSSTNKPITGVFFFQYDNLSFKYMLYFLALFKANLNLKAITKPKKPNFKETTDCYREATIQIL